MNVDERNKDHNEEPLHDNDVNQGPEEDSEEDPNEDQEEELEEGGEESEEYTEEECEETDEDDEEVNEEPVEDSKTLAEVITTTNKNDTVPESNSIAGDDNSCGNVCSRKQRRSRWDSGPTQDTEKKRKTRWSPLEDFVAIPKVVVEIQMLGAEFEELKRMLSSEVYDDRPVEKRSPSPPPEFDDLGFRTNTREVRLRDKLIQRYYEVRSLLIDKHPGFRPPKNYTPSKLLKKIYVPVKEYPGYKFAGLILGPGGSTVRQMEKESGARISLKGAGLLKETCDDDDDLHVLVMAETRESMDSAVAMIAKLLIPVQDDANYHKQAQLEELARLNQEKLVKEMKKQKKKQKKQNKLTSSSCKGCYGPELVHHYTCPHFESTPEIRLPDFPVAGKAICDSSELFVGSLPSTATSSQLLNLFSSFGPIKSARVAKKPINGESKGYGFVKFESPRDAAFAVSCLNGHKWYDKVLVVEFQEKPTSQAISARPDLSGSMEPDPQASLKTNNELGFESGPTSTQGGQNHKLSELFSKKIPIPMGEDCGNTWVGRILGLKGKNIKKMEMVSGARIQIRGNRSMSVSNKDGELHVSVVAETQASLDSAVVMVEKLLSPVQEGTIYLKQAQPNPYVYTLSNFQPESQNPKAWPGVTSSMLMNPQSSFQTKHGLGVHSSTDYKFSGNSSFPSFPGASQDTEFQSGPTNFRGGQNHKLSEEFSKKIPIPMGEDCGNTWVGRILGLKGENVKKMEKGSGARIQIRGNRSLSVSNEDGELHVSVVAETQASLDSAVAMVEKLLTPFQEGTIDLKQAQPNPYVHTLSNFQPESQIPKAWPVVMSSMLLNPRTSFQTKHGLGFHSSTDYKFSGNSSFPSFPGASQAREFQSGPTNFGKQASFSSSSELSKFPGALQATDFLSGPTNFGKQAPFSSSIELSRFPGALQATDFQSWPTNFGKQPSYSSSSELSKFPGSSQVTDFQSGPTNSGKQAPFSSSSELSKLPGAPEVTDFQSGPTNLRKQAPYSSPNELSKFPGALQVTDFQSGPTDFRKQAPFSSSSELSEFPGAPQVTDFRSGPTNFGKQASFLSSSELSRFPDVHQVTDFQSGLTNFRKQASFPSSELSKFPGAPQATDFLSEPTDFRKQASFLSSSALSKFPGAPRVKDFQSGPTNFKFSKFPGAPQVTDFQSGPTDFAKQASFSSFRELPKFPPPSQSYFPEPASQFVPGHTTESEAKNMTWQTTTSAYNWDAYKR